MDGGEVRALRSDFAPFRKPASRDNQLRIDR